MSPSASHLRPLHADSCIYGHCIGLQGFGSRALALDLPTFSISEVKGKAKVIILLKIKAVVLSYCSMVKEQAPPKS